MRYGISEGCNEWDNTWVLLLNIYVDIHKEHMSEAQNGEMIAYLMVWHLGHVLAKDLELYLESEMDLYLDNILTCGPKVRTYF